MGQRRTKPSTSAMPCPSCAGRIISATDIRWSKRWSAIRRRRICESCDYRWTTLELPVEQVQRAARLAALNSNDLAFRRRLIKVLS